MTDVVQKVLPAFCISVSDPDKASMERLASEGVTTYSDNIDVVEVSCMKIGWVPAYVRHIDELAL